MIVTTILFTKDKLAYIGIVGDGGKITSISKTAKTCIMDDNLIYFAMVDTDTSKITIFDSRDFSYYVENGKIASLTMDDMLGVLNPILKRFVNSNMKYN